MTAQKMHLQAIRFDAESNRLEILDQLLLPHTTKYERIQTVDDGWRAIREMKANHYPDQ